MHYLITGGAGFIGSHLTADLLARGDSVTVIDNLSTGQRRNVTRFHAHPDYQFVHGSVLDPLAVDELVHHCDAVFHLAAAVGVKLIVEHPLRSFTTNIRGTETVLDAALRYRKKVLLTSTSEIYGKNGDHPLREDDDRLIGSTSVARWGYSTAKAVDEVLAFAYHKERDLPVVIVRLFNTVGPGQSPAYGMVIPRFVRQALAGEPLSVYGDGEQTRCFCHVSDVVGALVRLMTHESAVGEVFNVGASEEISMTQLAHAVIQLAGSSSGIEFVPYEQAYERGFEDMRRRVPDTSKIHRLLGWRPTRPLAAILNEVIQEVRSERHLLTAGSI